MRICGGEASAGAQYEEEGVPAGVEGVDQVSGTAASLVRRPVVVIKRRGSREEGERLQEGEELAWRRSQLKEDNLPGGWWVVGRWAEVRKEKVDSLLKGKGQPKVETVVKGTDLGVVAWKR